MDIFGLMVYLGVYAGATTYSKGDVVSYNNFTYVSLIDSNTGNQPDTNPSDWEVLGAQTLPNKVYKTFSVSTPGSDANTQIFSVSLPAGTYLVEVEMTPSNDGGDGVYGLASTGTTVLNPFSSVTVDTNGAIVAGGGFAAQPLATTKFIRLAEAVFSLSSSGSISMNFQDYIYGTASTTTGVVIITPIVAA